MSIPPPKYKCEGLTLINGVEHCKYYGSLSVGGIKNEIMVHYKYYELSEYDAQEDVSISLIHKFVDSTGKIIKDVKNHTIEALWDQPRKTKHEKKEMQIKIDILTYMLHDFSSNLVGNEWKFGS